MLDLGSGTGHLAARLEQELRLAVVTADVSDLHVVGPPVLANSLIRCSVALITDGERNQPRAAGTSPHRGRGSWAGIVTPPGQATATILRQFRIVGRLCCGGPLLQAGRDVPAERTTGILGVPSIILAECWG